MTVRVSVKAASSSGTWFLACLACILALLVAGCEEDVVFVTGTEKPFELYGYLDPTADTQKVRLFPIEEKLEPNLGDPVDAVVISTNLRTDSTTVWRDSLAAYDDSTFGYLFWAPFRPAAGDPYRIVATRSDGAESAISVNVVEPPRLLTPVDSPQMTLPIQFGGRDTRVRSLAVEYSFTYGFCTGETGTLSFQHSNAIPTDGGQRVEIPLEQDWFDIRAALVDLDRWNVNVGVVIRRIRLHTVVTDVGWTPPGGVFDPEVLVDPNAMTNVENGHGFVSSGYEVASYIFESPFVYGSDVPRTPLSTGALRAAGFRLEIPSQSPGDSCIGPWPSEP